MSINTEKFLEDARRLTEQRMAAAEKIAEAISVRVAAEEALKEAEAQERKAYREAERHGWTKTELNKLKPAKNRRTPQKKTTTQDSQNRSNAASESNTQDSGRPTSSPREGEATHSSVMGNV